MYEGMSTSIVAWRTYTIYNYLGYGVTGIRDGICRCENAIDCKKNYGAVRWAYISPLPCSS